MINIIYGPIQNTFTGFSLGQSGRGDFLFELDGEFIVPFELTKLAKFLLSLNVRFQQLGFVVSFQGGMYILVLGDI